MHVYNLELSDGRQRVSQFRSIKCIKCFY